MSFPAKLALSVVAGLAVFAGLGWFFDWQQTIAALSRLELAYLPLILGLALSNYALRFGKWQYYLKVVGVSIPWRESLAIYLVGFMMAVTPGKLGEVVKAYLLKRRFGVKMRVTAPVVLADRLTDVIALLLLSLGGAASLRFGTRALVGAGALTLVGLAALSSRRLALFCIGLAVRIPILAGIAPKLSEAYESMAALIAPRPLLLGTLLSVPAWTLEGVAFFAIFHGMAGSGSDATPPLLGAVFIYAFSTLIGALSMLPGGLGAAEAGLAGLAVTLFGVPKGLAAAATLVVRILTLWFAVALGAVTFAVWRRRFGVGFDEIGEVGGEA